VSLGECLLVFILGVLLDRFYLARVKSITDIGLSWTFSRNRLYRIIHRLYCEFCPRRFYCKRYPEIKQATSIDIWYRRLRLRALAASIRRELRNAMSKT
jgi:hypothetical protein